MATQTGSIDLTATNGVKLFAKAGFDSAEQTYATKSELEVTNEQVALRATKTEATQMAQPNLSPFFSMAPTNVYNATTNPDGYWDNDKTSGVTLEQLSDGWVHISFSNTTTGNRWFTIYEHCAWRHRAGDLKGSTKYTVMLEFRNVTKTGSVTCIGTTQHATSWPSMFVGNSEQGNVAVVDGVQYHVGTTVADPESVTGSSCTTRTLITFPAGSSLDAEFRVSLYEGEYAGPYKPYSGDMMYATNAELKVTADGISTEVSKKVNGTEIISAINQSAELIQIRADKVNIAGATIFTTGRLSEDSLDNAYDSNGAAAAVQDNLDNLEIGGRNLLLGTKDWSGANAGASAVVISSELYDGAYIASYTYTNTGSFVDIRSWNESIVPQSDTYYTLSFWAKASTDNAEINSYFYRSNDGPVERGYNSSGNTTTSADGAIANRVTTEWQRVWVTWKTKANLSSNARHIIVARMFKSKLDGETVYLAGVKFEKGIKSTDWTPAPEDVDDSIATVEQGLGGFDILWNRANFATDSSAGGECYLCAYDPTMATRSDANGWAMWNGTKRTITKGMFNPNAVLPYNVPIYIVCRLSSATATAGTNYMVWYDTTNSKWRSGPMSPSASNLADWTWEETTDMVLGKFVEPGSEQAFTECETYRQPLKWGSVTTDTVTARSANAAAAAAQTTANAAAPKANAVKRTQRIYYRSNSSTAPATPGTASSNWVTKADDGNAAWTKMHVAISSTHKYIYTCEQYEMANGTVGYTSVLLDNTITVIDGGNLITGSVKANSIDAESGKFSTANIPELTADHIKASVISAVNNGTGTINADKINVSGITIGQSQVTNLETDLAAKADSADVYTKTETDSAIEGIEIGGRNLFKGSGTSSLDGWTKQSATVTDGVATITKASSGDSRLYQMPANGYWSWEVGQTYTVSVDAKGSSDGCVLRFNPVSTGAATKDLPISTEWARYSYTFTVTRDSTGSISFFNNGDTGDVIQLRYPKLEHGTRATDWTPAPEDTDSAIADVQASIPDQMQFYGTCSTAASTAAKVVVCDGFEAVTGARLTVKFSTANTANVPTLMVQNTASTTLLSTTAVWNNNAVAASGNPVRWGANATLSFVYDGEHWVLDEKPPSYIATTTEAATAQTKVASITGSLVINGTKVVLRSSNANTYTADVLKFNFSSTGAANVYRNNAVTSATNTLTWDANTVLTFVRQGAYWYLADNGTRTMSEDAAKTATNYISADSTGIKIANANPATATTYQHLTATSTEFVVEGDSMLELDGTNGLRIGKASENHISVDNDSVDFSNGALAESMFKIQAYRDDDSETSVAAFIDGFHDYEPEWVAADSYPTGLIIENGFTDYYPDTFDGLYYSHLRLSAAGNLEQVPVGFESNLTANIHLYGSGYGADETVDYTRKSRIEIQAKEVTVEDPTNTGESLQIGKPTSIYDTGSVSVANQSWVAVANLTIPSTGTWMVVVTGDFAANATGRRVVGCTRNDPPSATPAFDSQNSLIMAPANGAPTKFNSSAIIDFDAGDVYYAGVWQNSGSALTTRIMIKAVRLI